MAHTGSRGTTPRRVASADFSRTSGPPGASVLVSGRVRDILMHPQSIGTRMGLTAGETVGILAAMHLKSLSCTLLASGLPAPVGRLDGVPMLPQEPRP